jgi:hypothetical protein
MNRFVHARHHTPAFKSRDLEHGVAQQMFSPCTNTCVARDNTV